MRSVVKMLVVLLFTAVIAGCDLNPTKPVEQQIVYIDRVVHADPPKPNDVQKPQIPVKQLTGTESDDDTLKAYATSVDLLLNYSQQLEASLKPFWDAYNAAMAAKAKEAAAAKPPQGKK
jgi:hypothetical protein